MKKFNIEIGQKYGRLTVIEDLGIFLKDGTSTKRHYYKCRCDCGNEVVAVGSRLGNGHTTSCGCYSKEVSSKIGMSIRKYNDYYVYENIVFVKFSNCNEYFLCDLDDWEKLKEHCWYKSSDGYAMSSHNGKTIIFHRLVTNCPDGLIPDHIYLVSSGVCDNRKSNLRIATRKENTWNHTLYCHNTSGYNGVSFHKGINKWTAYITYNGKRIHLGHFNTKEEAYQARLKAEEEYFGEWRCGR